MTIPMTPADFTPEQRQRRHLVNDDANFFSGTFTENYVYYRVAYRHSEDATNESTSRGVVVAASGQDDSFVPPTYETFQAVRCFNFGGIDNFREPQAIQTFGRYTFFTESIEQAVLTYDFRDRLTTFTQNEDDELSSTPYTWDIIVKVGDGSSTPTWSDILIIDIDIDGTGLIKITETPVLTEGNIPITSNIQPPVGFDVSEQRGLTIPTDLGGKAFAEILFHGNKNELNFDGSLYMGGTTDDTGKRSTGTTPEPPSLPSSVAPTCSTGYTFNPTTNQCVLSGPAPPNVPTTTPPICPEGYTYDATTKTCVLD